MFFEALEKQCGDVRTFRGELPHTDYVVGAISTAKETTINRLTHDKLLSAEKAATIASLVSDYAYPADKIAQAYDNMLLYDEHTWGKDYPAGEIQDWAWNEKSHYAYKAAGLAQGVLADSLEQDRRQRPARTAATPHRRLQSARLRPDRRGARDPLPAGQALRPDRQRDRRRRSRTRSSSWMARWPPLPYAPQRWARGQFEKHELFDLVFVAENVPSMGYKTYRLVPREDKPAAESGHRRRAEHASRTASSRSRSTRRPARSRASTTRSCRASWWIAQAPDKLNQFVAKWVQTGKQEGPSAGDDPHRAERPGVRQPDLAQLRRRAARRSSRRWSSTTSIKRIDLFNRVLKDSTPLLEVYFAFPFKVEEPKFRFEGSNSVIEPFKDQFPGSNTNYYAVQHWANVSNHERRASRCRPWSRTCWSSAACGPAMSRRPITA